MKSFIIIFFIFLNDFPFTFTGPRETMKRNVAHEICKNQLGYNLNGPLLVLCREHAIWFVSSINGFKKGLQECQNALQHYRWNCTTDSRSENNSKLFGILMAKGNFFSIFRCI